MKNETPINGLLSPFLQKLRIRNARLYFIGNSFLDIGCSLGKIIPFLPDNSKYLGIEGNKTFFENAKKLNPNCDFLNIYINENNVNNLNIEWKFDTILMLAVIEHLKNPIEVLKGLKNYLKKDGRIIITTPTKFSGKILNVGKKLGLFSKEMHNEHKKQFTKKELKNLVKKAGYDIVHYHSFEFRLNHLIILVSKN